MIILNTQMYYGSPYSGITFKQKRMQFFTKSLKFATQYALGRVFNTNKIVGVSQKPTIYTVEIQAMVCDFREDKVKRLYEEKRPLFNKNKDPDDHLPRLNSEGFIMTNGLPSYGHAHGLKDMFEPLGYEALFISDDNTEITVAVFNVSKNCTLLKEEGLK
jgi:hypothetical protein